MSADSDFLGTTIQKTFKFRNCSYIKLKSHSVVGIERTPFFPAVPDEFLGDPPPAGLRAQQLQLGHYGQVIAYSWTELIK